MKRFCNFLLISFFVSFGLISRATVITHHVRFEPDLKIASQTADDGNLYSTVSLAGYKMDLTEGVSPSWYLQQDFTELLEDGTYRLCTAMADSKVSYSNHYLSLSQNLMGCPEIEIWSATPSQFSSAYITDGGSSVYVNTGGVNNCTISMISSTDFGASYQTVYTGVSQATFYSVPANYIVTITKHNYIPKIFD
jgi:hypothetical protein